MKKTLFVIVIVAYSLLAQISIVWKYYSFFA